MSVAALFAWMQLAQIAIPVGIATAQEIEGWIRAKHAGQLTDGQMNAAIAIVLDDAVRRRALAIADATGQPAPPAPAPLGVS